MRRFQLVGIKDETDIFAEGVQFSNGQCALHWLTYVSVITLYPDLDTLLLVHKYGERVRLMWIDQE